MNLLPILVSAAVGSFAPLQDEVVTFETFKAHFSKNYSLMLDGAATDLESSKRAAFDVNVAAIVAHNTLADAGVETYRLGVNEFSDLTEEDFATHYLDAGYKARKAASSADRATREVWLGGIANPATLDWRTKGAVTQVKNQGQCGSCWSFSATGALEGAYFLATGALRPLSEQQLMDCSVPEGNKGCGGGAMTQAFDYVIKNKGIDSESDYSYGGADSPCWTNASKRVVATMDNYTNVPVNSEAQLEAAVALGPVSVAIEADQAGFQSYKSGIFDGGTGGCGTKLDHGVLVVGYTADYWIVKNSWGSSWGMSGYIEMKRGVGAAGICGIATDATYASKAKGAPVPVPPPTPGKPPGPPCQCTAAQEAMCTGFGMQCCCGAKGNTNCMSTPPGQCCGPVAKTGCQPGFDTSVPRFMLQ